MHRQADVWVQQPGSEEEEEEEEEEGVALLDELVARITASRLGPLAVVLAVVLGYLLCCQVARALFRRGAGKDQ